MDKRKLEACWGRAWESRVSLSLYDSPKNSGVAGARCSSARARGGACVRRGAWSSFGKTRARLSFVSAGPFFNLSPGLAARVSEGGFEEAVEVWRAESGGGVPALGAVEAVLERARAATDGVGAQRHVGEGELG